MEQKTLIQDFTKGNITKQLYLFALPLFLSSLLQVVYNMVDMIIVGHELGKVGLSAVSVGGDVSNFLTFIAMGFCNAAQIIISQYIGAGQREKIGRFIGTCTTSLMLLAVIVGGVCLVFRKEILWLMNTPEDAYLDALGYSTICMTGMVFIYGYNVVSAFLRGMGDSKHPFIFISIAAVLNTVLDILFVMVYDFGAAGAALATVISQGISFVLCNIFLFVKRNELGFKIKADYFIHIDKVMFMNLFKLGLPMAIKSASIHISKLFVNSFINSFGVAVSAFAGVANKINSISNLVSNSLNTAGSSMVGQNVGAKQYSRVPMIMKTMFATVLVIASVMTAVVCLFPMQVFGIFTSDEAVLKIAIEYLPVAAFVFFGCAFRSPMNALINGSGNYKVNFAMALLDGIIMRIGLSALFGIVFGYGYLGFWLGDAIAGFTPFVVGIAFYFTGGWKKQSLEA